MNKLVILFLVFAALGSIEAFRKVAIENIRYLRLYKGRFTISPYPGSQLVCVENGARLCADHELDYVGCKNLGSNQGQVTWDCQATLSKGVKFGRTDVSDFKSLI